MSNINLELQPLKDGEATHYYYEKNRARRVRYILIFIFFNAYQILNFNLLNFIENILKREEAGLYVLVL